MLLLAGGAGAATAVAGLVVLGAPGPLADRVAGDSVALDPTLSTPEESSPGSEASEAAGEASASPERQVASDPQDGAADVSSTAAVVHLDSPAGSGPGVLLELLEGDDQAVAVVTSLDGAGAGEASAVTVTLADGRTLEGAVEGRDVLTNLAVLSLPPDDYPTAPLVDVGVRSGSDVSLLDRVDDGTVEVVEGTVASASWRLERRDLPAMNGLLQIATPGATAQPGAPVLDSQDQLVGIVTASANDWHQAIPTDVALKVGRDILRDGVADHARLGIEGYDLSDMALEEDTAGDAGVYVSDVFPDSPAAEVLQAGDVIVTLGGAPVTDISALQAALLVHSPGDEVAITYHRGPTDGPTTANVTLDAR